MCCCRSARPGTPSELIRASQGNEGAEKARSVTLKYDIEPLPSDITAEQRFFEGENQAHSTWQDMLLSTLYVSCFLSLTFTSVTFQILSCCCCVCHAGVLLVPRPILHSMLHLMENLLSQEPLRFEAVISTHAVCRTESLV